MAVNERSLAEGPIRSNNIPIREVGSSRTVAQKPMGVTPELRVKDQVLSALTALKGAKEKTIETVTNTYKEKDQTAALLGYKSEIAKLTDRIAQDDAAYMALRELNEEDRAREQRLREVFEYM